MDQHYQCSFRCSSGQIWWESTRNGKVYDRIEEALHRPRYATMTHVIWDNNSSVSSIVGICKTLSYNLLIYALFPLTQQIAIWAYDILGDSFSLTKLFLLGVFQFYRDYLYILEQSLFRFHLTHLGLSPMYFVLVHSIFAPLSLWILHSFKCGGCLLCTW